MGLLFLIFYIKFIRKLYRYSEVFKNKKRIGI